MSRTKGEAAGTKEEEEEEETEDNGEDDRMEGRGEKDCFLVARTSLSPPPLFRSLVVLFSRAGKQSRFAYEASQHTHTHTERGGKR